MGHKIKDVVSKGKRIARKIQGWLRDDGLDTIAAKLEFIGLFLTGDRIEEFPESAVIGAGCIVLELSEELKTLDKALSDFHLKLTELTTGKKLLERANIEPKGLEA
jgi:hypothetical protein